MSPRSSHISTFAGYLRTIEKPNTMFRQLQISDRWERAAVHTADAATAPLRWFRRSALAPAGSAPKRVLLLRLERIGDLLMVLDAIAQVRHRLPDAQIDLAVGSWNASLAALLVPMYHLDRVETLDAAWLSRDREGHSWRGLIARAREWRGRQYDLALNFEPDIRSNFLTWLSGAKRRAGYWTAGGGAFLTDAATYDPKRHVTANALALVELTLGEEAARHHPGPAIHPRVIPPAPATRGAADRLAGLRGPLVGMHAAGGRAIKQWPPERFRELAATLIEHRGATVILTGAAGDADTVRAVSAGLPQNRIVDVSGEMDLPALAALLQLLDVYVTGDTGPMHLAHAVGTPIVAIFGPSDPVRYGPQGPRDRIVRVDLPCSPCNRIRLPPARCAGHTPDCLAGVSTAAVLQAIDDVLREQSRRAPARAEALG
jgi:ADP-heptose:LPS heptosyltransferase